MKKQLLILLSILLFVSELNAQMGVNSTGAAPNPSAMLDVSSTTKGLLIPRMSTANKNNISAKPAGLMVYDFGLDKIQFWNGISWSGSEWTTVGNDIFTLNTGNVGIGNSSPQNKLQIGPTTSPPFLGNDIAIGNATGGGMSFFQSGGQTTGNSIWYSNSDFALLPAYGSTGCVGINFTSPFSRLGVNLTGKPRANFGSYISPLKITIGAIGGHEIVGDNYDAIGVAGFGANASNTKRNIGIFGTTGVSGSQNIGVMAYQNGAFANEVIGSYNELVQTGAGAATASFNRINNSQSGTNNGVYAEVTSTKASGFLSNFGVTSLVTNVSNVSAANYGFYANVTGAGTNYGLFASASGGVANYAIAAYGNSFFDSNVAIGATSIPALPLAKLVVTGFQGVSTGTSSYFNPGNTALYSQAISNANLSIYATHGIVSNLYIGAALSVTASDNRIKKDFSLSNNAEDLALLKKIEITNYRMKDVATWGNQTFKKVIAQQVEMVYPEVIKKQTSVIPDIYTLAESVVYDAQNKKLSVSLSVDYGIKVGDKIELVHPEKGKIQAEVVEVSGKSFTVKDWQYPTDKIFVFGREVNDFRSVDYEALSMLGISAIQALAKENEEMKKEIIDLKKLKLRIEAIEATLNQSITIVTCKQ